MSLRSAIKKLLPAAVLDRLREHRLRYLIEEINALGITKMGVGGDSVPWVEIENGCRFYGLQTTDYEMQLYKAIKPKIRKIDARCFSVIVEIIERYNAPRSIPGELIDSSSRYELIRDPLNDFDLDSEEKALIASRFKPKPGEVIVDIGAFHGFGTLRMADYIGSEGKIVAFEANNISLALLQRNINENQLSNVVIVPKAASNEMRKAGTFYYDGVPTGNSLRGDVLTDLGQKNIVEIEVDIVTADSVFSELGITEIDHASITVNGGEPEALEGMSRTISSSDEVRVTMPGWYHRDGERLDQILERKLIAMGFKTILKGKLGRVLAWK